MPQAGNGPLTERLFASLTSVGEIKSVGIFTLNPETARERIRRSRFANPLRYVLELVQAAIHKGAANISFHFGADDMHMYFDGAPFDRLDFESIYASLLLKADGGDAQARRLLGLGLCTALQLDPAVIRIESGDSFLELRPGLPDRLGSLTPLTALTHIHIRQRLGLGLLKRYVDHLGGHLTEEVLLQERCVHARVMIEIDGKRISEGYVLPDVRIFRTFAVPGIAGVVGIVPLCAPNEQDRDFQSFPESALSPTLLRLIKDGVWVDTKLPSELLPGFRALAENSAFRLDLAREHVVEDAQYAAMLRKVAATQLDLVTTLCRLYVEGQLGAEDQMMIETPHLRGLLRALLFCLGGLLPLLRWAQLPMKRFPIAALTEGNAIWPVHIKDGGALLEVPIFISTTGEDVTLGRLLADFAEQKTVAYSSYHSRESDPQRELVLHVPEPKNQELLRLLFGKALICRDSAMLAAWERERNRMAWLRRSYHPRLSGQLFFGRVPLSGPGISGEVGVQPIELPHLPWERSLQRPPTLRLLLIKDGCLLVEKRGPFPVPGLTVVVTGDFTPTYLYDDVLSDGRLSIVMDALFDALPSLIEKLAALPLPEPAELRWRAAVLRPLLMLTLSQEAREAARRALGVERPKAGELGNKEASGPEAVKGDIPGHLLWVQLRDWPLFEALDGSPLCPRDLESAVFRHGYLAVLCPASSTLPKRLESYSSLLGAGRASAEVWQKAHAAAPSVAPSSERPPLILLLAPSERGLKNILSKQLPPTRIVDAESWLRAVEATVALRVAHSELLTLPDDCELHVPLPEVEGRLGVIREGSLLRAFQQEPRVAVALLANRHHLGNHEIYLPGGQFISAVADHPALMPSKEPGHIAENAALGAVRKAMAAALPELISHLLAALAERPLPWPPLFRLLLFDVMTALFPRPAFRLAYEDLRFHASRNGAAALKEAEAEYAALLRLTVATSLERLEAVLERHLASARPLSIAKVRREVLSLSVTANRSDLQPKDAPEVLQAAEPPPFAMAWLDALYPPRPEQTNAALSFGERALGILPALAEAPLFMTPDGAPLRFKDLLNDFHAHGHVLHTANASALLGTPTERPVIYDPGAMLLSTLHCLLGPESVREPSAAMAHVAPPLLPAISWPPAQRQAEMAAPSQAPLPVAMDEELLLATVVQELRALGAWDSHLLNNINLAWLRIEDSDKPLAVICDSERFIINRRHPAVQQALRRFGNDPQYLRFLASAVYTALSARLEAATHEHAERFHHHLAVRALAAVRRG